jgi:hypothetical protein
MKHRIIPLVVRVALCVVPLVVVTAQAEVKLEAEQRESLGIQTVTLTSTHVPQTYSAIAQVLDAAPLVALLRDFRAAQSAAIASHNELERAEQLHAADGNVSRKVLEAARVQALSDAGHADALQAQLLTTWGPAITALKESERDRLVTDVLESRAVLVRAEARQTDRVTIKTGKVRLVTDDETLPAEVLGLSAGSTQTVGRSYLLRVASPTLQVGQVLDVELQDAKQSLTGIVVPRSAIVRWQGDDWVYIETESNHFARKAIHPVSCPDEGCLVQKELEVGQSLVTIGGAMLLAVENSPAPQE